MRVLDRRHPVPKGFVDGVAERAPTRAYGDDIRAQRLHLENVEPLATNIFFAHVDLALQAEECRGGRGGDAMLPGPGLGDDTRLAHPPSEECLADAIVDLVSAGVIEVFTLEEDAGAAGFLRQPLGEVKRRRPAYILPQGILKLALELRVLQRGGVNLRQLHEGVPQRFRHVPAARPTEPHARMRPCW